MKEYSYNISDWNQATKCLSNNSRHLYIAVDQLIGSELHGTLVSVKHTLFGTLFACIVSGSGDIVSSESSMLGTLEWLTTDDVLKQLAKFGFDIQFNKRQHLSDEQLLFLSTVNKLGFDHLARFRIVDDNSIKIAAFNANNPAIVQLIDTGHNPLPLFANTLYSMLSSGQAMIVPSDNYSWDWLNYVANIQDILDENHYDDNTTSDEPSEDSEDDDDSDFFAYLYE